MPTQTFPCPFCGKKMGVGVELLGRKVRCPHCNQILVAPSAAPLQPQPTPPDIPKFNLPSAEARESIFGEQQEEEGDDVFGTGESDKPRGPEIPPPEPVPTIQPEPPTVQPEKPKTALQQQIANEPTVEMTSPFGSSAVATPLPPIPSVAPVPLPSPVAPSSVAGSSFGASNNPWSGMENLPTVPPALVPVPLEASPFAAVESPRTRPEPGEERPRRSRAAAPPAGNPLFKVGFFILAPYALIVTIAAIYGLFFKSSVPAGHPLSNLPDNFGEYGPAERKKTGRLPVVDGELPADQRVALGGGKIEIGQLEIEPVSVQQRPLKIVSEPKGGGTKTIENKPGALVLTLRIRNRSEDTAIHPLDPAFNRRAVASERIGTGIVVGKSSFWGGAISWPFSERVNRIYEAAQEGDATPLKAGETREYVVFTDAGQRVVKTVREATEPILWRVHVRRGRIDFNGKDLPVTAIIGIEFKPSDVKDSD